MLRQARPPRAVADLRLCPELVLFGGLLQSDTLCSLPRQRSPTSARAVQCRILPCPPPLVSSRHVSPSPSDRTPPHRLGSPSTPAHPAARFSTRRSSTRRFEPASV